MRSVYFGSPSSSSNLGSVAVECLVHAGDHEELARSDKAHSLGREFGQQLHLRALPETSSFITSPKLLHVLLCPADIKADRTKSRFALLAQTEKKFRLG